MSLLDVKSTAQCSDDAFNICITNNKPMYHIILYHYNP